MHISECVCSVSCIFPGQSFPSCRSYQHPAQSELRTSGSRSDIGASRPKLLLIPTSELIHVADYEGMYLSSADRL
nr:hypothetical protein CFP56_11285 [Quercus suber]